MHVNACAMRSALIEPAFHQFLSLFVPVLYFFEDLFPLRVMATTAESTPIRNGTNAMGEGAIKVSDLVQEYRGKAQQTTEMLTRQLKETLGGYDVKDLTKPLQGLKRSVQEELKSNQVAQGTLVWNVGFTLLFGLLGLALAAGASVVLFGTLSTVAFWGWLGSIVFVFVLGALLLLMGGLFLGALLVLPFVLGFSAFSSIPIGGTLLSYSALKCILQGIVVGVQRQRCSGQPST
mmetsp:Transcript_45937/g.74944  ORF Transcript_45937/g.74944 Transcript_45937/m.74944 type:complete len:234 (-) Transcript_45937:365-1066(-)